MICHLFMDPSWVDSTPLDQLVQASLQFDGSASDAERNCWMAVHQQLHDVLPSEYDIREVPEELYPRVLALRRASDQSGPADCC